MIASIMMKKILFLVLLSTGTIAKAQQAKTVAPINGCWVVENNIKSPKKQIVKFYDDNQQLLYQEEYNLKVLSISKKRIRRILDSALVSVLDKSKLNETSTLANVISAKH